MHEPIFVCAPSKFGKSEMANGTKKYVIICTEPNGSGWLKHTGAEYHTLVEYIESDELDPMDQLVKLIRNINERKMGIFLDSLSALENMFINWYISDLEKDRERNKQNKRYTKEKGTSQFYDGRYMYQVWARKLFGILRWISDKPVIITCLTAEYEYNEKQGDGASITRIRNGLRLTQALAGIKIGTVTLGRQFNTVLVGKILDDNITRIWITPDNDNRPQYERQLLPVSDPLNIMGAYAKGNNGLIYTKKNENELCFVDRLWNYCEARNSKIKDNTVG